MLLSEIISQVREYHSHLGYPNDDNDHMDNHRLITLAMAAETMEVLNAAPWKPWKNYEGLDTNQINDMVKNVGEELVDVLFFMVALMSIWDISNEQFEMAFKSKLAKNYDRLEQGYNSIA